MRLYRAFSTPVRPLALSLAVSAIPLFAHADQTAEAKALLNAKCGVCHLPVEGKGLNRIDQSRRTPEGWDMTIGRMVAAHGVRLTSDERLTLVKYLADTHGLAPEETAARRYLLERDFTQVEKPDDKHIAETCARCHSYGRIALQRRTEEDWRKLANFHVGQFPTIEIQQGGRDRNWWEIASQEMPKALGKRYAYDAQVWNDWLKHQKVEPTGSWRVTGHRPGWGFYEGVATVNADGSDHYKVTMQVNYANGKQETAEGKAVLFTGYEWRATVKQGGEEVQQVLALSADGQILSGRWFLPNIDSIGGTLQAVRSGEGAAPRLVAVQPTYIKSGTTQTVTLYGSNLSGEVALGAGIQAKVLESTPTQVVVEASAASDAQVGARTISVGNAKLNAGLALYKSIDYIAIEPGQAMARVGDNGGSRPKVPVQFESVAYTNGPDGKPGTADDIRLGYVQAAWSVDNGTAYATSMSDVEFAGKLDSNGLFVPGDAGPNPQRKFHTNNAGDLKVTAVVDDGGRKIEATRPLVVTVQRWNDPPVR